MRYVVEDFVVSSLRDFFDDIKLIETHIVEYVNLIMVSGYSSLARVSTCCAAFKVIVSGKILASHCPKNHPFILCWYVLQFPNLIVRPQWGITPSKGSSEEKSLYATLRSRDMWQHCLSAGAELRGERLRASSYFRPGIIPRIVLGPIPAIGAVL